MQSFAKRNDGLKFDNELYWRRRSNAGFENTLVLLRWAGIQRRDAVGTRPSRLRDEYMRNARDTVIAARARPFTRNIP